MIVAMPPVMASRLPTADEPWGAAWQMQPTLLAMIATAESVRPMLWQWLWQMFAASSGTRSSDPTGATQLAKQIPEQAKVRTVKAFMGSTLRDRSNFGQTP